MPISDDIDGQSKLLGLIGFPLGHSVSPQLHNTLSKHLGINAAYIPLRVEKGMLGDAVKGIRACGFTGFNVTLPYKEEILQYVDEISDEVEAIGSANTVVNRNGRLIAYNTDGEGFLKAYETQMGSVFKFRTAAILGAGGAARSLAVTLASTGVSRLYIYNRTLQRASAIADLVNLRKPGTAKALSLGCQAGCTPTDPIPEECQIIINTTPLGMYPDIGSSPLEGENLFKSGSTVCDIIYNPSKTKLLRQAEECGCRIMNGMGMLLYQGILAYEKWMDIKIPDDIIQRLSSEFMKYLDS